MNCIDDALIQKYIDGEASAKEIDRVEVHIALCSNCAGKVLHQKRLANEVKRAIGLLGIESREIPAPEYLPRQPKKKYLAGKRFIYHLTAACILLFVLFMIRKNEPAPPSEITFVHSFEWEVDANRPVSQQDLGIQVIDAEGNVSEYLVR